MALCAGAVGTVAGDGTATGRVVGVSAAGRGVKTSPLGNVNCARICSRCRWSAVRRGCGFPVALALLMLGVRARLLANA